MTTDILATVVVLGLCAYRITRFLVIDSLLEPGRTKFHVWLESHEGPVWDKFYDLVSCTWCVGIYVSMAVYALYVWNVFIDWSRIDLLTALAVAGVQGMAHAIEPESS